MAQVNNSPELPDISEIAAEARSLVRRSTKGSLATLDAPSGAPYASLITLAAETDGSPIFLISTLARHTRNLAADPRAAILVDGTGASAADGSDPLQGARLTLSGTAARTDDPAARRRVLARQAQAAFYADFPDFSFWRLQIEGAHFIGGFGRIVDLAPEDLLVPLEGAETLIEAEEEIVAHMNEDHADAVALYAQVFGGASPDRALPPNPEAPPWRMSGLDPLGCDLVRGTEALRIDFADPIRTPQEARRELVRLVDEARATIGSG
jgi:putative heme iron utilization protein